MVKSTTKINRIVDILKRETKQLKTPSVTLVGRKWGSPFLVLISCVLSLRTKDEVTLRASERLFALAKTPKDILRLSALKIEKAIYPVGFYHTKARNILAICRDLVEKFDGDVPDDI